MKEWLSINELATRTNIADTTIRRYIAKFPDFFLSKGGSRSKRYEDSAIKILIRIKDLYDGGFESEAVESTLRTEFSTVVVVGEDGDTVEEKASAPVHTLATADDINEIKEALKRQEEFNKLLIEKLNQQDTYIKESLQKRDQMLMESLRSVQEEKKILLEAAASRESQKPSFFSKWFGKKNR